MYWYLLTVTITFKETYKYILSDVLMSTGTVAMTMDDLEKNVLMQASIAVL